MKSETLEKLIAAKRKRRNELSKLSFKKKIEILVQLQKMAQGVKKVKGDDHDSVWTI